PTTATCPLSLHDALPISLVAALCAAGLPSDRFIFEGFLPAKRGARRARLEHLREEPRTLIFYEAPHRILECLQDLEAVFGGDRPALLGRELTKTFETLKGSPLGELRAWVEADSNQDRKSTRLNSSHVKISYAVFCL